MAARARLEAVEFSVIVAPQPDAETAPEGMRGRLSLGAFANTGAG